VHSHLSPPDSQNHNATHYLSLEAKAMHKVCQPMTKCRVTTVYRRGFDELHPTYIL